MTYEEAKARVAELDRLSYERALTTPELSEYWECMGNLGTPKLEATPKSAEVEALLEAITGRNRGQCVREARCAFCGGTATVFKDPLSRKEYTISGMCQACQDATFGEA